MSMRFSCARISLELGVHHPSFPAATVNKPTKIGEKRPFVHNGIQYLLLPP
jgi:hypothetical protein